LSVRAIAFHLPQFHPIPENDEWWGEGFTDWTNVAKAKPRFAGHHQPHEPADLGFYDLRMPEARAAQAALAKAYGIYGFCYYHYWFNGRRLLEHPVNEIVESGEPDFPFCLCWANENWTRRWDGLESEILMRQEYGPEDDLQHIRSLLPIFADRRYIRVEGKPLFLVYRASLLPEPRKTIRTWRHEAEKAGLKGLYLARVECHGERGDPREIGFDAAVEFPPANHGAPRVYRRRWWHLRRLGTAEAGVRENYVHSYGEMAENAMKRREPEYPYYRGVCPGWDNSARRVGEATIFIDGTPEKYERWLMEIAKQARNRMGAVEGDAEGPLVFINAWNEWAEGNHLEPCRRWGRAYLEATRRALGTGQESEQREKAAAAKEA